MNPRIAGVLEEVLAELERLQQAVTILKVCNARFEGYAIDPVKTVAPWREDCSAETVRVE